MVANNIFSSQISDFWKMLPGTTKFSKNSIPVLVEVCFGATELSKCAFGSSDCVFFKNHVFVAGRNICQEQICFLCNKVLVGFCELILAKNAVVGRNYATIGT